MKSISDSCQENINNITTMINKAVKEIKIANARAESAEKMLMKLRNSFELELKKAYNEGYQKAVLDSSNASGGGSVDKDDTKLILKSN